MSAKGYDYKQILSQYFPGTQLQTIENGELKMKKV